MKKSLVPPADEEVEKVHLLGADVVEGDEVLGAAVAALRHRCFRVAVHPAGALDKADQSCRGVIRPFHGPSGHDEADKGPSG